MSIRRTAPVRDYRTSVFDRARHFWCPRCLFHWTMDLMQNKSHTTLAQGAGAKGQ